MKNPNITTIWIEEATELTDTDFSQINLRMRGKHDVYKQVILTFNPISTNHWIYDRWFSGNATEHDRRVSTIHKFTYKDNHYLEQDYIDTLEALKETNFDHYKVYCLGEFGTLEGGIYRYFESFEEFPFEGDPDETFYGMDFGFNNPTAVVRVDIHDGIYYVTEILYKEGLTNRDLINFLTNRKVGKRKAIYCDAAEPQRIEEMKRIGYNAYPANKSVKDGILTIQELHGSIKIHTSSANLNNEIINYRYKKDRDGRFIDEPVKDNDHLVDAMRYAIHTYNKNLANYKPISFKY